MALIVTINLFLMNLDLSPAHLHLALNHIPIIGIAVSCLPIVIGILAQCRTTIAVGLLSTLLCAAAMPTIMQTGGDAAHNFDIGKNLPALDAAGQAALDAHADRADKTTPVIYACAILAVLALLALIKFPQAATWLSSAVLLGNVISISLGIWTAQAGGRIRHPEFRPPTTLDQSATTPTPAAVIVPISAETPKASPEAAMSPLPAASPVK